MAPEAGSGPFTGHRLAASALSTTKPFRPPVQVFFAGFAAVSVDFFGVVGCAFFVEALFFGALPNDSAFALDWDDFVEGGVFCPNRGDAMIADARRNRMDCCTALARREGDYAFGDALHRVT
jgi:hypothetical protein